MKQCWILAVSLSFLILSCQEKKKPSLSGEETVEISDFIASFPLLSPVVNFSDELLEKKTNDSLRISYKIFTEFVPDSLMKKYIARSAKPAIYPLAAVRSKEDELYLFSKITTADKQILFVSCFSKQKEFDAGMEAMQVDKNKSTSQVVTVDRGFVITKTVTLKKEDGSSAEGKDAYAFDKEQKNFSLIMTEPLDGKISEVVNPIDTLPVKNKFSADYVKDKLNIVSIRDAKKPGKMLFFIHFDKDNGNCSGEIRGEAKFTSATKAVYTKAGDGCQLQFSFTSSSVSLKELTPCGNWRGVMCSFDASYPKKRTSKPAAKKKS